jgi:hypothetical protein
MPADPVREEEAEFYVLLRIRRGPDKVQTGADFIAARKSKPEVGLLRSASGTDETWVRMRTYVPITVFMGTRMQKSAPCGAWAFPVEVPDTELT